MSELRAPGAKGPSFWLRPKRRRRGEAPVRYLLDSRLFRLLCAPGREAALAGFRASVVRQGLGAGEGLPALELTPMAFLATIGVDPPHFDAFPLPPEVLKSSEYLPAMTFVAKHIESRFRESPELQPEPLQKRVEELRQATEPAAHDLFDLCLTSFVSREDFQDPIIRQLAFDFLYRFPFPEALREEVFQFLCASLFAAGETVSGLSKMRAVKILWDRAYPRLLKANPAARGEIQALDREMKLRTRKDYLAWEVIHHAILGSEAAEQFRPVTAFTLDSEEKTKARCIAYKSALRAFLDQIGREDLEKIGPKLQDWRPGALAPCQEDGTFEALVPTGDLPVFGAEKLSNRPLERPPGSAESTPEPSETEGSDRAVIPDG